MRRTHASARTLGPPWTLALLFWATAATGQAELSVTSAPAGARLFVDGYHKGNTPCTVTVHSVGEALRSHRLVLILQDYETWHRDVGLRRGQPQAVHAELRPRPTSLAGKTVCISPGHPSDTGLGARGPTGATEVHVNWVVSLKLREALAKRGANIVFTKHAENELVSNRRRAEIANEAQAGIFIRIHCDQPYGTGFGLFYPDRQGERNGFTGPPLSVIDQSRTAARAIHRGMKNILSPRFPSRGIMGDSITDVGRRQGALTGSIFSKVPVVSIEMCVLTTPADEKFITSPSGQELMVEAIVEGLDTYFRER